MEKCQGGQCGQRGRNEHGQDQQLDIQLREQLKQIRYKFLVMSGKGGVGKSSVAAYLAIGLAMRGYQVGLLDVDLHGPSIPHLLGIRGMFQVDEKARRLIPIKYRENLEVVSIECLLEDKDSAVIWRGPLKHGVIKQFLGEVEWGKLDYLVIDSPPGTGDEPLSIAQTIPDAHAIIVATPQEVALADVRKSINFCRKVHMPILGLVENMSGLICPNCGTEIPIFRKGGGRTTAERMNVPLLGSLPFDPKVVEAGDAGLPLLETGDQGAFTRAIEKLIDAVLEKCPLKATDDRPQVASADPGEGVAVAGKATMKIAIPLADGVLCNHFGHCQQFAIIDVKDGVIAGKQLLTPPPHEPGVLPRWLGDQGVTCIIAGGMGQRALGLFEQRGIRVITGAPALPPETLVEQYLDGTLVCGPNVCDH